MLPIILVLFIYNVSGNTSPWNTTLPNYLANGTTNSTNPASVITLVRQNIPWAFPFLTMVLMLATDYVLSVKKGIDIKMTTFAVALAYTVLSYVEVSGGLTDSAWFYFFETIMIGSIFFIYLYKGRD